MFHEEIGKLKHTAGITCPRCRTDLTFRTAVFVSMIERARSDLALAAGNTRLTEKKA
jgi:hypothetical protein